MGKAPEVLGGLASRTLEWEYFFVQKQREREKVQVPLPLVKLGSKSLQSHSDLVRTYRAINLKELFFLLL